MDGERTKGRQGQEEEDGEGHTPRGGSEGHPREVGGHPCSPLPTHMLLDPQLLELEEPAPPALQVQAAPGPVPLALAAGAQQQRCEGLRLDLRGAPRG